MSDTGPEGRDDAPAALGFVRVLDLSESVAGQFCGRMLADHGARVVLVEPPGGSCLRRRGPWLSEGESAQFLHLNLGKQSFEIDAASTSGRKLLRQLAVGSDVAIVPAGFDRSILHHGDPRLIVVVVSPFGEDGPMAHWRASEIVYQAMSGTMIHNGDADREPLYGVGDRASYSAGVAAYTAILAALAMRERSGVAQEVAIDVAHVAASMAYPAALQHAYNGATEGRGKRDAPLAELRCRDAYMSIWLRPAHFGPVCEVIAPELLSDARFDTPAALRQNFLHFEAELQVRVSDLDAADIVAALQAHRVVAACCFRATQLGPDAPHLRARGYWQRIDTPAGERLVLGPQFRLGRTPRLTPRAPVEAGRS